MERENKSAVEIEGGRREEVVGVANKQNIKWTHFVLRFLVFALTLVAAIVLGVDKQDTFATLQISPNLPPLNVPVTAKWNHMSAFVYFVVANSIACAYAFVSLVIILANRGKSNATASLMIVMLDLIAVGLLFTSGGAAAAIGVLGYQGNSGARWNKVCNVFGRYCGQVAAAVGVSFVGSLLFLLLIFLAALNLHKKRH